MSNAPIRFAAVGLNHNHIYGQTKMLLAAGAELAGYVAPEDDLAAEYARSYPQARRIASAEEVLADPTSEMVKGALANDLTALYPALQAQWDAVAVNR